MARKTFTDVVQQTLLLNQALKARESDLPQSLNQDILSKLADQLALVQKLNQEQEKLKAALKAKTADLGEEYEKLKKQASDCRKRVKLEYPQTQWKEFGIEDKH